MTNPATRRGSCDRTRSAVLVSVCWLLVCVLPWPATPRPYRATAPSTASGARSCHVNPAGGGPAHAVRQPDDRARGVELLALPTRSHRAASDPTSRRPSRWVSTCATCSLFAEGGRGDQVSMQADAHVVVEADENVTAFLTLGDGGAQEYGGIAYVLPLDGYVKVGRFTPDYGWRWDDHFMASRRYLLAPGGTFQPRLSAPDGSRGRRPHPDRRGHGVVARRHRPGARELRRTRWSCADSPGPTEPGTRHLVPAPGRVVAATATGAGVGRLRLRVPGAGHLGLRGRRDGRRQRTKDC